MSVGGSISKNKSESQNQSEYNDWAQQNLSEEQQGYLTGMWQRAMGGIDSQDQHLHDIGAEGNQRLSQAGQQAQGQQNWLNQQAGNEWQNQLGGGAYAGMDNANRLSDSLQQSMGQPSNEQQLNQMIMGGQGNNYADAMKGQYMDDANRAQQMMTGNMDARAAASGMSGGSRHGTAIGQGNYDINKNLQRNMAETGFNTFDKDLDRKLGIARNADNATLQRQGMMQNMLGQQQNVQQGALDTTQNMSNLTMNPYNLNQQFTQDYMGNVTQPGQQQLSWMQQLIGGPTVLNSSGSTGSSSGSGSGSGFGMSGSQSAGK